jgi:hypothetical protein
MVSFTRRAAPSQTTIIQNTGGFAARSARMPLAAGGKGSNEFQPEQRECYFRPDSYYAKRPDPLQLSGETRESVQHLSEALPSLI